MAALAKSEQPFLTDVKTLRERARKNMGTGAVTGTYRGDVKVAVDILQSVLATELVCVLRYTQHAIVATGLASSDAMRIWPASSAIRSCLTSSSR